MAVIARLQLSMDENNFDYRQKLSRITDVQTIHYMNKNQNIALTTDHQKSLSRFPRPEKPRPLLIDGYKDINEVVNLVINSINTTRYINNHLDSLIVQMDKLDKEILDKYMSKME